MSMPPINELKENLTDIQGNVLRGYGLRYATYRFYNVGDREQGRNWLKEILKPKTGLLKYLKITTSEFWPKGKKPPFTLNIAYSHLGLTALDLDTEVLATFPEEFRDGMRKRAVTILGDEPKANKKKARTNENHETIPKHWKASFLEESDTEKIHFLVMITAETEDLKKKGVTCLEQTISKFDRVKFLFALEGKRRPEPNHNKEHFGFTDGISQPYLEGTESLFEGKSGNPGQGTPEKNGKWQNLKPGEFILGYEDEFGEVALVPSHYDLRKNGTYLVLRVLEEDVAAFRKFLKATAKKLWPTAYQEDPDHFEGLIAAKIMGRWPSGCPVIHSPSKDNTRMATDPQKNNNFLYKREDPEGKKCPLGAHIRRANPRDQLLLTSKDIFNENEDYEYHLNRHRIIRRGLPYGNEYRGRRGDGGNRGVIFMAFNSSIGRQFEFLQRQWINNGEFLGLDKTDRDPIMGMRDGKNAKFTVPGAENPFAHDLQRFVTERGGEYFFYPGLTALRKISEGAFGANPTFQSPSKALPSMAHQALQSQPKALPSMAHPSFLSEYQALKSMSHPFKGAAARQQLVSKWLIGNAKEMFDELREKKPIFIVPPVPPPKKLPDLGKPWIVIATKYDDVLEILRDQNENFSVALYAKKMVDPRGPFVLGLEHHTDTYKKELNIIKRAVYPQNGDVGTTIYDTIDRLASEITSKIQGKGKIDVIEELVWPVTLRLNGEFFGVPGPGPGSDLKIFKRWCRDIYTDLFLNLRENKEWERRADIAVTEMNNYLDDLIQVRRKELKNSQKEPETVLDRLIQIQEGAGDKFDDEDPWVGVRRNIFGMVIAVVETTLKAVPRTIDQLLKHEGIFPKAREAALAYSHTQDPGQFKKYVFEAMRFNPQNHVLFRLALKPFTLAVGTDRETDCPAPALVFAGNLGAMFDAEKIQDPEEFRLDRPDDNYLFFGYEHHRCLGEQISRIQIPLLIKHVVTLSNLRRPGGGDQFAPLDLRPEHFLLEFDAS